MELYSISLAVQVKIKVAEYKFDKSGRVIPSVCSSISCCCLNNLVDHCQLLSGFSLDLFPGE